MDKKVKDKKKVASGKKSRAQGQAFELKVRKDLESKGWIVGKWANNVEFYKTTTHPIHGRCVIPCSKIIPAKPKMRFNPKTKSMSIINMSSGFPDFVCLRFIDKLSGKIFRKIVINEYKNKDIKVYEVIGVESKMTGKLDKEEKEKCRWYLDNNIFSKILIAEKTKIKNKVVIVYNDFEEKYGK